MVERYVNRELSWLEFNARVLEEAVTSDTPLLERMQFLAIFTANLDEFFMVRIAGLLKMEQEGIVESDSPEEVDSTAVLKKLKARITELVDKQYKFFHEQIIPQLANHKTRVLKASELSKEQRAFIDGYFRQSVFPVLTPLSYDAAHPFPFLSNLSIYLALIPDAAQVSYTERQLPKLCFVEVPSILPQLIKLPSADGEYQYYPLEDLIADHLGELFIGIRFKQMSTIRVTRNLDYELLENEVVDLLKSIKKEMVMRSQQEVVRLQITDPLPEATMEVLKSCLSIGSDQVYMQGRPIFLCPYRELCKLPFADLKYPPFNPRLPERFAGKEDIFSLISREEFLVHHPYESFYTVTEFVTSAAADPNVLAIKQTLYRTAGDSPIIQSLIDAAQEGKQVTAVIELKARFDEKNNIVWARDLERAGVNVVFGFVGLKTHCKATLVVRREGEKLVRYVHLSTGNYNPNSAKIYTDVGFFTTDEEIADDMQTLFNMMTGINMFNVAGERPDFPRFRQIIVAPLGMRGKIIELIDREIAFKQSIGKGRVVAKMNALVDKAIIDKLYEASRAGVEIKLLVRGICCLVPGVPGMSENIQVISIIDRFLEHSRIFYFEAAGKEEVFLSSADWMPRNMDRRIEIMFPVRALKLKDRLINEILSTTLADNVSAREMLPDGTYQMRKPAPGAPVVRSQSKFIELARQAGLKSLPYDKALAYVPAKKRGQRPVENKGLRRRKKKDLV